MESSKVVLGVIGGVAVGALLGVLFAPDKGSKTRKKIMETGKNYSNDLKEKFEGLYQDVADKYESLLTEAKSLVSDKEM
jgi:gas vesicle protein